MNNTAFVVGVDDFHGVTSAENGVVFHDFVGDTLGNVFSGDFFDAQFTCGDDDADAAGFVLVNDSCHGVTSAEDGDADSWDIGKITSKSKCNEAKRS